MKTTQILPKVELFVFLILLLLMLFVFPFETKQTYEDWEWFVDAAATGADDGSDPDNAWTTINGINWGDLDPGDVVYVKSQGATAYTLSGEIDPGEYGVTLLGVNENDIVEDWDAFSSTPKAKITYDNEMFHLTNTDDYITIENFIIDNTTATTTEEPIIIDGIVGFELIDCDVRTNEGNAIFCHDCSDITVSGCTFYQYGSNSGALLFFDETTNVQMSDCSTEINSGESCESILEIDNCCECMFIRNKIFTVDGSSSYGILVHNQTGDTEFNCNVVYGDFSGYSVSDDRNTDGIAWNFNTMNNTYQGAGGFFGWRTSNQPVTSFRNNISNVNSSTGNAIMIFTTASYWKPTSASYFCYNSYNNEYSGADFASWNGTGYDASSLSGWVTAIGTGYESNTAFADPNFEADGYHLDTTPSTGTPTSILNGGLKITGIDYDIDKGEYSPSGSGKTSKGADQYAYIEYSGTLYSGGTIDFQGFSTQPAPTNLNLDLYGKSSATLSNMSMSGSDFSLSGWTANEIINTGTTKQCSVSFIGTIPSWPNTASYSGTITIVSDACYSGTTTDYVYVIGHTP